MKLILCDGPLSGSAYPVTDRLVIGRHPSAGLVLPDPSVSQIHCVVLFQNGLATAVDQGSTNGVFVNGRRILRAELRHGDEIRLGQTRMIVALTDQEASAAASFLAADDSESDGEKELSRSIFETVTYDLKRKIADGGMGSIYEAVQFGAEGFTKKVAIKTILPEYAEQEEFVSAFIAEAKLVANLVHPNIVQIHHLGRHGNGYYIAMEYVEGINLTEFLALHEEQGRSVSPKIAAFIISRVCRGLEYAHTRCDEQGHPLGLVHRDVTPNNILIGQEGEVKLADFGIAQAGRRLRRTEPDVIAGSPQYMSPEQAEGRPLDARSDFFSLGVVFYELLTGHRLFEAETGDPDASLQKVRAAVVPDPCLHRPNLPRSLVNILLRLLHRNPEERFTSAGELATTLETELYAEGYGPTIVTLARYTERLRSRLRQASAGL